MTSTADATLAAERRAAVERLTEELDVRHEYGAQWATVARSDLALVLGAARSALRMESLYAYWAEACECPRTKWIGADPNDSPCGLGEDVHMFFDAWRAAPSPGAAAREEAE